jgi:branched-chain amino acid transport system ATP-binding protein
VTDAPAPLLTVRDLRVVIGGRHILHGVDLEVAASGTTALLGRNGAGKTTTVRGILGLVPRTGSVLLAGEETVRLATHALVRRGIGYAPEDRGVFATLSVAENLRLAERPGAGEPAYGVAPGRPRAPSPADSSRWWPSPGPCSTATG